MIPRIVHHRAARRTDETAVIDADRPRSLRRKVDAKIPARSFVSEQIPPPRRVRRIKPHLHSERPRPKVERRMIRHDNLRSTAGQIHSGIRSLVSVESRWTRPHCVKRRQAVNRSIHRRAERARVCSSGPGRFVEAPCSERTDTRRNRGGKRNRHRNRTLVMRENLRRRKLAPVDCRLVDTPRHRSAGTRRRSVMVPSEEQRVCDVHRLRVRAGEDRRTVQIRRQRARDIARHHEMIPRIIHHRAACRADEPVMIHADFPRRLRRKMNTEVPARSFVSEQVPPPRRVRRVKPHLHRKRPRSEIESRVVRHEHAGRSAQIHARIRSFKSIEIRRPRPHRVKGRSRQQRRIFHRAERADVHRIRSARFAETPVSQRRACSHRARKCVVLIRIRPAGLIAEAVRPRRPRGVHERRIRPRRAERAV